MRTLACALAATACLAMAGAAVAGDGGGGPGRCDKATCCACCGCTAPCKKVCRVVCQMKEVEVTCWEVECEEFCVPLPRLCGRKAGACERDCVAPPKCGKVRCRKKLVKKKVTRKVPVYKCVVEHVCGKCCGHP